MNSAMEMNIKNRFYEIDLLRIIAALSVVFFHYTFRGYAADNMSILPFLNIAGISKYGYLGVDLFFMISGFVILMTALNNNASGFLISRVTRLYPTFWICATLTALVTVFIGGIRFNVSISQYFLNLTMINQIMRVENIDGVYWTLFVELKFYFLIFIILSINQMNRIKLILGFWMLAILYISYIGPLKIVQSLLFPEWAYYFIAGAMYYLIRHEGISIYKIVIIILSFGLALKGAYEKATAVQDHYHVELNIYILSGLIAAFYALFFLISTGRTAFLNKKIFLKYSAMTYPLYLIHKNIGYMGFNYFGNSINKHVLLTVTIGLMFLTAYLINLFVDKKFAGPFRGWLRSAENLIVSHKVN